MKKINDEYTFSEALEKVIEEGKRLNNPTYDRLLKRYVSLAKSYNKLLEDYKVLIRYSNTLESVNKKLKAGESYPDWKQLTEENKTLNTETDKLTKENELLKQKDAMRENQFELLNEYIKFLESRLNNQEDDDKVYPEYHTHDTFKVHNKLAEVVSVLVDKDDDVYGYEIKFEDSDDTFIVYPEEIEY